MRNIDPVLKAKRDNYSVLETLWNEGMQNGINEEKKKFLIRFMKKIISIKGITKITGYSIEEISKL